MMSDTSGTVRCVACRHETLSFFGRRNGYAYHKCENCGTIQLVPLPTEEELKQAYTNEYAEAGHYGGNPEACVASSRTYHEAMADTLGRQQITGEVVDYGAGWGGLVKLLRERGFKARGLELATEMVAHTQSQGLPVESAGVDSLAPESVDALTLTHVFEHLVNHDQWLDDAVRALRPTGVLVIMIPTSVCGSFVMGAMRAVSSNPPLPEIYKTFAPPWHTALFSPAGMEALAQRHGLELVETRPAPQGRVGGLTGAIQVTLEQVNKVGWALGREKWPLATGHTFVLRKPAAVTEPVEPPLPVTRTYDHLR